MDKDKEKTSCLRCNDTREVWVWKDTSDSEKIKVDCTMFIMRPFTIECSESFFSKYFNNVASFC